MRIWSPNAWRRASQLSFPLGEYDVEVYCINVVKNYRVETADVNEVGRALARWPTDNQDEIIATAVWDTESAGGYYVFVSPEKYSVLFGVELGPPLAERSARWWNPLSWDHGWPKWERDVRGVLTMRLNDTDQSNSGLPHA